MLMVNLTKEEIVNVLNSLIRQFTRLEQPTATTALKYAVGAVLKTIPTNVKYKENRREYPYCPNCRSNLYCGDLDSHCWNCGQALNWDTNISQN